MRSSPPSSPGPTHIYLPSLGSLVFIAFLSLRFLAQAASGASGIDVFSVVGQMSALNGVKMK